MKKYVETERFLLSFTRSSEMNKLSEFSRTVEDYMEVIYDLVKERGYANVVDIAERMNVKPPSVTYMLQKLSSFNLLNYERYRSVTLTPVGEGLVKTLEKRHKTIKEFLVFLGVDEEIADADACEIEHTLHPETMEKLTKFVEFVREAPWSPRWLEHFRRFDETGKRPEPCKQETKEAP